MQIRDQQYATLKQATERTEKLLKKHVDENQHLKRELKNLSKGEAPMGAGPKTSLIRPHDVPLPRRTGLDFKTKRD